MKRILLAFGLMLMAVTLASAQNAPRPRDVPTKPATPCSERDFIQARDTHVTSLCQNALWKDIATDASGAGNFGIGTTSPTSITEISRLSSQYWNSATNVWAGLASGVIPSQALTITNTNPGGYDPVIAFQMATSTGVNKLAAAIGVIGASGWTNGTLSSQIGDIYFNSRDSAGVIRERLRIASNGNVGIGLTDPDARLEVGGYTKSASGFIIGEDAGVIINESETTKSITLAADNGNLAANSYLRFAVDGSEAVRIIAGGNVGIGTTSPADTLDVNGGVKVAITTVAGLPTCNGALEGSMRGVSDALAPAFLTTVVGGGAVHAPVYCNGSTWVAH